MSITPYSSRRTSIQHAGVVKTLRAASGALRAGEASTGVRIHHYVQATLVLTITDLVITDTGSQVDFYIQTSFDEEVTWTDMENIHFDNTDSTTDTIVKIIRFGVVAHATGDTAFDNTDGTLTDDTKVKIGLGTHIRVKVVADLPTGDFYDYSCVGFFR